MSALTNPLNHANCIVSTYQKISQLPKLEITPEVMEMLHQFLGLLSNEHGSEFTDAVLAQQQIQAIKPRVQTLFSQASSIYERHWAYCISKSIDPVHTLEHEYPYFKHYQRATALEINAAHSLATEQINRVLMVGSGALPLTSLALHNAELAVDNLDIHQQDLLLGKEVCDALAPAHRMNFIHNDICKQDDLACYDVIWLAALVGDEKIKRNILHHLFDSMAAGSLLVVRTAYNLRTLLYPSVTESDLAGFQVKLKIQTFADNFHSILIAQKPYAES